jgi:hypothetical protein
MPENINVRLKMREKGKRSMPGIWAATQSAPSANHGLRIPANASTMRRKMSSLWCVLMDFMKWLTMVYAEA